MIRQFPGQKLQINKHVKQCWTQLTVKEMKIKMIFIGGDMVMEKVQ